MSYNPFNLSASQGVTNAIERSGNAPILWTYSTADGIADVFQSDYIKDDSENALSQYIQVGDIFNINYGADSSFTSMGIVKSVGPIKLELYRVAPQVLYTFGGYATVGGATTEIQTIPPVPDTTLVIASLRVDGPNNIQLISAELTSSTTILYTFTANPGVGAFINYAIFFDQEL
jgi:hypothetical protein